MKRGLLVLLAGLFALGWAQESDLVLQSYSLASENLDNAVAALPEGESVTATDELERALGSLRVLSGEVSGGAIVNALESTFAQAQQAIQNRSETDLAVQVSVIRGGFWRLVYEAALEAAQDGDTVTAGNRLQRVGEDMGFSEERLAELGNQAAPLLLLTTFEQGIADVVTDQLNQANEQLVGESLNQRDIYLAMSGAYGRFLPVQDSPRASGSENSLFAQAFQAIVDNDSEALSSHISVLSEQVSQFGQAAASATLMPDTPPTATIEAEVADAATDPVAVDVADASGTTVAETVADPVDVADSSGSTSVTDSAATPEATSTAVAADPAQATVPVGPQLDVAALTQQLTRFGLPLARQQQLADTYLEAGYGSVNDVMDQLFADSARAVVAVEVGDQDRAHSLIEEFEAGYLTFLEPIVNERNSSFNASTLQLINTLQNSPALRLQDAVVLTGHVDAISSVLSDNQTSGLHQAIVGTTNIWSGWLRLALVILLGIAAFIPLYLLYLAFGGGNRNWQLVGWALFLLLLPLIYEGFSYLAGLVSMLMGGIGWLDAPAQFSLFQNTISQVIWVLLTGTAIALATAGLYGICVQFGLLGRRTSSAKATSALDTSAAGSTTVNTSFDWDEEF